MVRVHGLPVKGEHDRGRACHAGTFSERGQVAAVNSPTWSARTWSPGPSSSALLATRHRCNNQMRMRFLHVSGSYTVGLSPSLNASGSCEGDRSHDLKRKRGGTGHLPNFFQNPAILINF